MLQLRHVEDQDSPRIIGRNIIVNIRVHGVLDLNPGDIIFGAIATNDNVLGLTDIQSGI